MNTLTKRLAALSAAALMAVSALPADVYAQPYEDGTFTVGFDSEFPPYGYKDESGEYVGFDLDLAAEVCKRRGWTLVKQPIDWDSKDMELETGAIDCIWNGFTIDGREDSYTWSVPYIDNSQVIVVKDGSGITEASQLAGRVVAVQTDSSALAAFTSEDATDENKALCGSFRELQQVGDYNSAFLNLDSGAVDAICMDVGVANYEVSARNGFVILDKPISSEKYGVGFLKGNTILRDQVQDTMLEMSADGTFEEIADKWGLTSSLCIDEQDAEYSVPAVSTTKTEKSFSEKIIYMMKAIAKGLATSLAIFFLTLLFSQPLGLLIAIIGFTLNYAAYFAEIYRSGIQAVPKGQYDASDILGYSRMQRFFRIVFPQMVKNILPAVTNEVITLVKDTSLAFAVSCTEMFTLAKQVAAAEATIMPLFIAGLFYYIFNALVALAMGGLEKKYSYFR